MVERSVPPRRIVPVICGGLRTIRPSSLSVMVVVTRSPKIKPHRRTIVGRGIIIRIRWRVWIRRVSSDCRRRRGRSGGRLVHIKKDLLRDVIFGSEITTRLKHTSLNELVGLQWQGTNDVIIRTEVVKGTILVTKDLQVQRGLANDLAIGFDPGTRRSSINRHIIGDGVMGPMFEIVGRRGRTTNQQSQRRCCDSQN